MLYYKVRDGKVPLEREKSIMEELVLYFSLKYEGDFQSIYNALINKEQVDEELRQELKQKLKCSYTTVLSDDYPESLKIINCPPFVLYYYGDLSLTKKKMISIAGSREVTEYGKRATHYFATEIANDYVIVSGMARGVDTIAHKSAIECKGKTIAVLGTGIEYCYPRENKVLYDKLKESHLVISEYPGLTPPQRKMFPFRNRIITGLSEKLIITESRQKSGTMITAGYALEQGKDIYCVPSPFDSNSNGCNELIKQGAYILSNIDDLEDD